MPLSKEQGLKAFLAGTEGENPYAKAAIQNKAQATSIERLKGMMENAPEGSGAAVTPEGASYTRGINPLALQNKQVQGDSQARSAAGKAYMSGLPKIQDIATAASEGLDLSNDPQNIGSIGQARTLMLKAMGMKRYNEQEAKAVLPSSLQGHVATIFNSAGADIDPLNEVQRSSINQFFKGQLDNAAIQHKQLKQNAMGLYTRSPYASESGLQEMGKMGAETEQAMAQAASKYKDISHTKGPNLTPHPNPGPVDKLKSFLGMGGQQPQAQAPQASPSPSGGAPMSFEDWKKANGR